MTKNQAVKLMESYSRILADCVVFEKVEDKQWKRRVEHLIYMPSRIAIEFSEAKTMRWLGYMQGQLEAMNFYTLEELKEHSRTGVVTARAAQNND